MSAERPGFLPSKLINLEVSGARTNLFIASRFIDTVPENNLMWETHIASNEGMADSLVIADISIKKFDVNTPDFRVRAKINLFEVGGLGSIWDQVITHPNETAELRNQVAHGLSHATFAVNFLGKLHRKDNRVPYFMRATGVRSSTMDHMPVIAKKSNSSSQGVSEIFPEIAKDNFIFEIETDENGNKLVSKTRTGTILMGKLYPKFPLESNMV